MVDGVAQVARHVLLERRAELSRRATQAAFFSDHRVITIRITLRSDPILSPGSSITPTVASKKLVETHRRLSRNRRLVEQRVEERNQQREREPSSTAATMFATIAPAMRQPCGRRNGYSRP